MYSADHAVRPTWHRIVVSSTPPSRSSRASRTTILGTGTRHDWSDLRATFWFVSGVTVVGAILAGISTALGSTLAAAVRPTPVPATDVTDVSRTANER
jgi:hypothetical protein